MIEPRAGFDRPRPSGVANSTSADSPRPNSVARPRISGTCSRLRSTVAAAPAAKNSMGAKKFSTSRLISPRRPTMEMPLCQRGQMPPAAISRAKGNSVFSSNCCARSGDMKRKSGEQGVHHNAHGRNGWRECASLGGSGAGSGGVGNVGVSRSGAAGFQPGLDARGVAGAAAGALRVEQDDDHVTLSHMCLHHQTVSGFVDETRFRQAHIPVIGTGEAVGVVEGHLAIAHLGWRRFFFKTTRWVPRV